MSFVLWLNLYLQARECPQEREKREIQEKEDEKKRKERDERSKLVVAMLS